MAVRVIFKLKEPQSGIPPAAQKETPVNLFFNYGYSVPTTGGKKKYKPLKYATGLKIKPCDWHDRPVYRAKRSRNFDHKEFNFYLDKVERDAKLVYNIERNKGYEPTPNQLRELLTHKLKLKSLSDEKQ